MLGREEIAPLLPHAGRAILIDAVQDWDAHLIHCIASSHKRSTNPLRNPLGLPAIAGMEYALQAMLIHAGLIADGKPAALKPAAWGRVIADVDWLDKLPGMLTVEADLQRRDESGSLYAFAIHAGDDIALDGEALLVLK